MNHNWILKRDFSRGLIKNKDWFLLKVKGHREPVLTQFYKNFSKTVGSFYVYEPAPHEVRRNEIQYDAVTELLPLNKFFKDIDSILSESKSGSNNEYLAMDNEQFNSYLEEETNKLREQMYHWIQKHRRYKNNDIVTTVNNIIGYVEDTDYQDGIIVSVVRRVTKDGMPYKDGINATVVIAESDLTLLEECELKEAILQNITVKD